MRFAFGMLASALVLFTSAALGFVGTWALVSATVGAVLGALLAVIAMEERELRDARRLPVRRAST
jgi:hypothetical protein